MLPRAKLFKKSINTKFSNLLPLIRLFYFLAKLVLPIPFVFKVSKPHLPWHINRICWDPDSYFGVNRVLSPYLGYIYLSIVKLQGGKVRMSRVFCSNELQTFISEDGGAASRSCVRCVAPSQSQELKYFGLYKYILLLSCTVCNTYFSRAKPLVC